MNGKEKGEMTCEEIRAENARLEQEVHALTTDNERLRSELAASRDKFDRAHENWRNELAKVRAGRHVKLSPDAEEVDIEIPGVITLHLKGRAALRFAGIEVPDAKTEKMDSDIPMDAAG